MVDNPFEFQIQLSEKRFSELTKSYFYFSYSTSTGKTQNVINIRLMATSQRTTTRKNHLESKIIPIILEYSAILTPLCETGKGMRRGRRVYFSNISTRYATNASSLFHFGRKLSQRKSFSKLFTSIPNNLLTFLQFLK